MSRLASIAEFVASNGFASTQELATHFDVNVSTIRRDLSQLATDGRIVRTHGGAAPLQGIGPDAIARSGVTETQLQDTGELAAIGRAMAHRILDGQTVLLSSGPAVLEVAKNLSQHERLTVITNDLAIGLTMSTNRGCNLIMLGGELLPNTEETWGPLTTTSLDKLRADVAVFDAEAVGQDGIYSVSSYGIELRRKMRAIASEAFFVASSDRFGREGVFKLFELDEFTAGITDSNLGVIRAVDFSIPIIRAI